MKKKVLGIALVVMLIAIVVSGTLAYFTAEDEAINTFTYGSVEIEIYENDEATTEDTRSLGKLTPVVKETPSDDVSYIDKVVDVKNIGANDAYIRTHIAIPTDLINYLQLDVTTSGWSYIGSTTASVGGVNYTVFTYDHTAAVAPNGFTSELLQGVYLKSDVDLAENADGNLVFVKKANGQITHNSGYVAHTKNADGTYTSANVNILVASEAIQAQGFENGATNALNSGFEADTNPWQ